MSCCFRELLLRFKSIEKKVELSEVGLEVQMMD